MYKAVLFSGALLIGSGGLAAREPQAAPAYRNPDLPISQRVDDLISRMTLEEKVSQLVHTADAIPRLGVPSYDWWNEGLHGVARAGVATVFPQAIGMAATFDEPLMHRVAGVIGTEFRAKYAATRGKDGSSGWYGGLTVWSPNINIFRDPRWGRGQESYGEDPFLTSRMAVAYVTGLQGGDSSYLQAIATPKHFAVHSGPESTRHMVDVTVSRQDLEDTYLPAFRAAVLEGHAASVMCAYNSLDGQPACASSLLLQEHLRRDWRFQGYVVTDCGAMRDVFSGHHFAASLEEAAADIFKSGADLVCRSPPSGPATEKQAILSAAREGILPQATIDRALHRLFEARFRLGMFDPPARNPFARIRPTENDTQQHRELALRTARESLVLLKNANDLLPLTKRYGTIAVIGPDADSLDALEGNYNGTPSRPVTVLEGIRKRFTSSKIVFVAGTGLTGPVLVPVPGAVLYTDLSRRHRGLKGEYFAGTTLNGKPAMTRLDRRVDFMWGFSGVSPRLAKNYSVRWTGVLVPPQTRDYLLGFTGQDGYRLRLDGKVILEDWTTHRPSTTSTAQVHLEQGQPHRIEIEYFQTVRGAEARLVWGMPGVEERAAVAAAKRADLVVAVLGLSARVEGEEMKIRAPGFSGGDRTSIDLPAPQLLLLKRLAELGKPVVLVLVNGSALAVNWADQHVPAILEAWYPGEEGGDAVAQALAGDFSPGGRLPITFYRSVDQLPPFDDYSMARRTYRYFEGEALYPFGYGLSYTSFTYGNIRLDRAELPANGSITAAVDVRNSGKRDGDEVVQLYLTHRGIAGAPLRALAAFRRVHLAPGQSTTVSFVLRERLLSIVDSTGVRRIVPGDVDAWIGGGQPLQRSGSAPIAGAHTRFRISTGATLPD